MKLLIPSTVQPGAKCIFWLQINLSFLSMHKVCIVSLLQLYRSSYTDSLWTYFILTTYLFSLQPGRSPRNSRAGSTSPTCSVASSHEDSIITGSKKPPSSLLLRSSVSSQGNEGKVLLSKCCDFIGGRGISTLYSKVKTVTGNWSLPVTTIALLW